MQLAVRQDLRVQPCTVGERLDRARLRSGLERLARLAELHAAALDLADPKALADQIVQAHAAREDVAPGDRRIDREPVLLERVLELLCLDQRQLLTGTAGVPVAVALEP